LKLISQIFNDKTAFLYGFFMATEPYLIGIDRWVHLTSLETYFSMSAVLTIFLFHINRKFSLIPVSGALLGLAVLSKLTSLMVLPFIVVSSVIALKKQALKPIFIFLVAFTAAFFILFPAMWTQPLVVMQKLTGSIGDAVTTDVRGNQFTGLRSIFYYVVILLFKLSPVTLLLFMASLKDLFKKETVKWPFLLFLFSLVILTLADKKIDRYVIFIVPALLLTVAIYLANIRTKILTLAILTIQIGGFIWASYRYLPVYSAYYSPIIGGEKQALKNGFYENSGEYFAQAAKYMNSKPRKEIVYVPDNFESFSYFHKGTRTREFSSNVQYVVNSVDFDRKEPNNYGCTNLEKTFGPSGFNAVYIFSCNK
jgi:hypothetical protein